MGSCTIEAASVAHVVNQNASQSLQRNARLGHMIRHSLDYIKSIYRSTDLMHIRYDDSYAIGVAEFDGRRQTVVDVYNELNFELRLIAEHAGSISHLNDKVSLLVRLIGGLFAFEEALMADIGYSQLAAHRARHNRFLESLHSEFERIQRGRADMHDLSYLIGSWLSEHMRGMDMAFGDFVAGAVNALVETGE